MPGEQYEHRLLSMACILGNLRSVNWVDAMGFIELHYGALGHSQCKHWSQ